MNVLRRIRPQYLCTFLWCTYLLYLILLENLFLFPNDIFEIIIPAIFQFILTKSFISLFKKKYMSIISMTALTCCILVILWHFCINHGISRKAIVGLFVITPVFLSIVSYFKEKIRKIPHLPVIKNWGISFLLTLLNFIAAIFTFYVFHYWI